MGCDEVGSWVGILEFVGCDDWRVGVGIAGKAPQPPASGCFQYHHIHFKYCYPFDAGGLMLSPVPASSYFQYHHNKFKYSYPLDAGAYAWGALNSKP